jgi:hypothetical protein
MYILPQLIFKKIWHDEKNQVDIDINPNSDTYYLCELGD